MRLSVDSLRRVVKRDLAIEFVPQQLTSYGGLELLRRYVQRLGLAGRLRQACAALGGDYSGASLALLILALLYAGGRRLEHLRYLAGDALVTRFCGLAQVPSLRTVSHWLQRFTQERLEPLVQLNQDVVLDTVARLKLPRLTIDVDGTVVRTGPTVAWAFRGFNPHHRKDPSYYPLLAHLAQTGHILRVKNRPGNVHDSKQAVAFLRELIDSLRARLGRAQPLEFRMDAAFCQRDIFRLLTARRCAYAIKVGYWSWLPLKALAAAQKRWQPLAPDVTGFMTDLPIPQWNLPLRVMIYRKHVQHETPKNFQLDLFTPDDGHFEYYAVATNMTLSLAALYAFVCGRGAQEKTLGELKGEFALDVVPTRDYGANSAWQQLSVLAHNVARSFQLDTIATPKPRSRKRTYSYVLRSIRTLRFLLITRAGRLTRIDGRNVLRLTANAATEQLYAKITHALAA
jgi:DDE family transposase